ncbi:MAG: tetratricopeptide repeat protein [Microscillaceae bacterium]|nr:tetratricopeptide repeat protein [Microscillaceae bacterium]
MRSDNFTKRLNFLFTLLQYAEEKDAIKNIEADIWEIWMDSGETQINTLMEEGSQYMNEMDYNAAIDSFTLVIALNPNFAEGWNQRAMAYFMRGSFKQAIEDIKQVLSMENRHFGALSILGEISLLIGDFHRAIRVYERLLKIYPHNQEFRKQLKNLKTKTV